MIIIIIVTEASSYPGVFNQCALFQECKAVECNEEPLEDFVLADSTIDYTKGSKDSLLSPSTWLKYLNPMEWFNGVTGESVLTR